jgi:hypothetical protein
MSKALAPALILGALLSTGVAWAGPATRRQERDILLEALAARESARPADQSSL